MTEQTGTPDAMLVARSLDGDATAYASLMHRHFADAFAVARRLTENTEDAEDACQEAFARAYFRLAACGSPDRFRGWLLQVVRHHAHNVRRYQALRAADVLDERTPAEHNTTNDTELRELRTQLHNALQTLPPVKRAVVKHHDVDGWTHTQVAQSLGISVTMSRRHLSDARAVLRRHLGVAARDFLSGEFDNE